MVKRSTYIQATAVIFYRPDLGPGGASVVAMRLSTSGPFGKGYLPSPTPGATRAKWVLFLAGSGGERKCFMGIFYLSFFRRAGRKLTVCMGTPVVKC